MRKKTPYSPVILNTQRKDSRSESYTICDEQRKGFPISGPTRNAGKERVSPDAGDGDGEAGAGSDGDGSSDAEDRGEEGVPAGHRVGQIGEAGEMEKSGLQRVQFRQGRRLAIILSPK